MRSRAVITYESMGGLWRRPPTSQRGAHFGTYSYKLIIVGDADTGKSSLLRRLINDDFATLYNPTIGVDFQFHTMTIDGVRIKLQIWDTAGLLRFRAITHAYYREAVGVMIVYSVTQESTFNNVPNCLHSVKGHVHPDAKVMLVGTKGDCTDNKVVDYIRARDFANERQIPFFEVSNKDGTNVELAFMKLATEFQQSETAHAEYNS